MTTAEAVSGHTLWPPNGTLSQWILDQFPRGYRGWAVDVGASDGISINTTFALEKSHRWTVLSVEANPDYLPLLIKHRAWVESCACSFESGEALFHIHENNPESFSSLKPSPRNDRYPAGEMRWKSTRVRVKTVDQLMAKWDFPQLDLLAIDVEGTELDVLRGCDLERWRPLVICAECWDKVGPMDPYLEEKGYKKTARSVDNWLWLRGNA